MLAKRGWVGALTVGGIATAATVAVVVGGGAAGAAPGTVHTKSGAPLTIRSAATSTAKAVGSVRSGAKITIICQTTGQTVSGKYGRSAIWDKISKGYISDAYVYTGSDKRVAPTCAKPKPTPKPKPKPKPTPKPSTNVAKVIAAAKSQTGKGLTYSWGGGGKAGPSYGICCSPSGYNDKHRYGYDCSGLMQFVFWHALHKDIGGSTYYQYKGHKVAKSKVAPGDMIFYGHGSSTTHVALYIGGGKMIEAAPPRNKTSVHVTSVRWSGAMPYVVRAV
jgi:cell wall-associated NlpC family hydrolase